jgi:hypothetical protein
MAFKSLLDQTYHKPLHYITAPLGLTISYIKRTNNVQINLMVEYMHILPQLQIHKFFDSHCLQINKNYVH